MAGDDRDPNKLRDELGAQNLDLDTRQTLRLVRAFNKIKDPLVREQLIAQVETLVPKSS